MSTGGDRRPVLYCVVPRDVADRVYEPLREHFRADPEVVVVVERRLRERRIRSSRRLGEARSRARDRRSVRSQSGRRIAERRAVTAAAPEAPELPRRLRRFASRLAFIERCEPCDERRLDDDSKRLVVRFQSGETAVFGELYLRYFDAVYSYCRVALRDHHEAEDMTQQVFTRALDALPRYELRPGKLFRSWLFTIARNAVLDALKAQHELVPEPPDQIAAFQEDTPAPAEATETLGWLTDREVAMFVERLPLAQRQVLVLRFMLELSGEEVAQVLGRSHVAVRRLQSRALQTLAERLAAVGRGSARPNGRTRTERKVGPLPVLVQRRFALGAPRRLAA